MLGEAWRREIARIMIVGFGSTCIACGGGPSEEAPPTRTAPSESRAPTFPAEIPEPLSENELRDLVAPVALYPDVILASLLPATTYPDDLRAAAVWVDQQGGDVAGIPDDVDWDGSVSGLCQFPDVLRWADENEAWTATMGDALTYQQSDVLVAIQGYRHAVKDAGNLESNEYQEVTTNADDEIRIAPAQPETVYVPTYDTAAATQPQEDTGINPWLAFGGGVAVGALGAWALYSIFDDDDDDHHHGGGKKKKTINNYNNYYYYGGGRRPSTQPWQPKPRPATRKRHRRQEALQPTPYKAAYATSESGKRGGQRPGGIRPPKHVKKRAPTQKATAAPAVRGPGKKKTAGAHGGEKHVKTRKPGAKPATAKEAETVQVPFKKGGKKKGGGKKKKKQQQKK